VGVEVRWDKGGIEPAGKYTFFYGKGNKKHELGTIFLYIIKLYLRVEFVSDMMSHIILRGCWCDIVLNIYAPTDDKTDHMKGSFYKD
jgi:hypothetical protein